MTDTSTLPKRVKEWMKTRTRAGEREIVYVGKTDKDPEKNSGLPQGEMETDHLHCPCSKCGHEYQMDCEEADCKCCSSLCT